MIYYLGAKPSAKIKASVKLPKNCGFDSSDGDYKVVFSDHINFRYQIIERLGRGSFGQALKCFDYKTWKYVCIKVIKNQSRFFKQGLVEVNVLDYLTSNDAPNCVKMTD